MSAVTITNDGHIIVDGKVITPAEVATLTGTALTDIHKIITALHNKTLISWKNAEKLVAYIAATIGASNGFDWLKMPSSIREWLIGGAALVLAAIHSSTPTMPTT